MSKRFWAIYREGKIVACLIRDYKILCEKLCASKETVRPVRIVPDEPCVWIRKSYENAKEYFVTCQKGDSFMRWIENSLGFKFCPYCGRRIKVQGGK